MVELSEGSATNYADEVAIGGKGPEDQLDRWAITIRFEDENSVPNDRVAKVVCHFRPYLGHRNIRHTPSVIPNCCNAVQGFLAGV